MLSTIHNNHSTVHSDASINTMEWDLEKANKIGQIYHNLYEKAPDAIIITNISNGY